LQINSRMHYLKILMLFGVIFCLSLFETEKAHALSRIAEEQREGRLEHAQELLGSRYSSSVVRTGEQVSKINGSIYKWTRASLPRKHSRAAQRIAQLIIDESLKQGFDPIFVLAIIQTESSFNPDLVGGVGEIGLMQIRPETGEWIAKKSGLLWRGKNTLRDPVMNIKIGCAYLSWLRDRFDFHARLYLAAYNMGQRNVLSLLARDQWPKEYPARVMQNYVGYYEELRSRKPASHLTAPDLPSANG
jgi:soluble lytic murein transglycosylase